MGICNSTSAGNKKGQKISEDLNLNYSYSIDEEKFNDLNFKNYVKLNINLLHNHRGKKSKDLILKKIYLNNFGKLIGEISAKNSSILNFYGSLNSQGNLFMELLEKNKNSKIEIKYEGALKFLNNKSLFNIEGIANKKFLSGETGNERFDFILNFGENSQENLWLIEYTFEDTKYTINPYLDLNDNEMFISNITGIAYEEGKGISIFSGIEDDKREITLTQTYLSDSNIHEKVFFVGIIDRIKFTIEGLVKGGRMDGSEFKISRRKN